ncbi:MAG: TatD family deoxyribonuclease [Candidatus Taylorbacteria bacterium]|nr:TatD family deoxyribonuclease [Candidatus Taylorbacteria bacterium]
MFKYIDIHSHVNFSAFDADREATVKRALDAGVAMINVGTQQDTSKTAVEMAEKYENGVFSIIGLHPVHTGKSFHDEKELGPSFASDSAKASPDMKVVEGKEGFTSRGETFDPGYYRELLMHPKVVGIGECGLDYYRLEEDSEQKQKQAFSAHIALANETKKPLMLHVRSGSSRSAYREALDILKREAKVGGDFHFFAGSWEEAREILDAGFNLSFTGVLTFAHNYDEVVKNVPLDRMMSETDSPYVAPVPFRGKRNEPIYVREVVKAIARIRNEDEEKVRAQLLKNAETFFDIKLS